MNPPPLHPRAILPLLLIFAMTGCTSADRNQRPSAAGGTASATGGTAGTDAAPDADTISTGCVPAQSVVGADGSVTLVGKCPEGLAGPTMVNVPAPQGCTYCVDSTEVTNAQYAAFLAARAGGLAVDGQDPWCAWNTTYVPSGGWPATGKDTYAVTYVDWCDAFAYCRWAGKHLCGAVGGGDLRFTSPLLDDEWYLACSRGGTQSYPYGNTYDPNACNTSTPPVMAVELPVPTKATCEGGYPGLFDLSGNVSEWANSCVGPAATGGCEVRGGSVADSGSRTDGTVACNILLTGRRDDAGPVIGFRCCGNAL